MRSDEVSTTRARVGLGLAAVVLVVLLAAGQVCAVPYIFTQLERTGWTQTIANEVNNAGQVAGAAEDPNTISHAVRWDSGALTDLRSSTSWWYSDAYGGIDSSGRVIGAVSYDSHGRIVTWAPVTNTPTEVGYIRTHSCGRGFNAYGVIVGYSLSDFHGGSSSDDARALLYTSDSGIQTLDGLGGGHCVAWDINDDNVIVGRAENDLGQRRACVWENLTPTELVTLGGSGAWARAVNNSGLIAGYAQLDNAEWRACVWDSGAIANLGTLGGDYSRALGLNEIGQVVGQAKDSSGEDHACLWQDDEVLDLNDVLPSGTGWVLTHAADINDSGRIVGWGTIGGQTHAWMLTVIPEPATVLLVGIGVSGVLGFVRRRRRDV